MGGKFHPEKLGDHVAGHYCIERGLEEVRGNRDLDTLSVDSRMYSTLATSGCINVELLTRTLKPCHTFVSNSSLIPQTPENGIVPQISITSEPSAQSLYFFLPPPKPPTNICPH